MKKYFPLIGLGVLLVILAIALSLHPGAPSDNPAGAKSIYAESGTGCNVATVAVSGFLDTEESSDTPVSSWDVSQEIRNMDWTGKKALIVFLDSDGGLPQAAEEVSRAIDEAPVPTVAYVRGDALSGGYWIAASTGHIIALQSSLVGNIGVNSSFLNQSEFDQSQGYTYEQITSGAYKDADSVDKPLTDANRAFIQGVTNDLFAVFSSVVMKGRNMTAQQFSAVSDGRYYVASKGLQLGLIDEIGDISQVENYVATKTGTNINNLQLCDFPG